MDAKDLMIGNWVKCGKRYMKVTQLAEDMDCDDIEPIPLTPEILEKNGFSKSRLMGEQRHFTYYLAPYVSLLAIYDTDFSLKIGECARYIKYIHELQHALRLCGIDKEITI